MLTSSEHPTLEQLLAIPPRITPITPADQGLFTRMFLAELELERYPNSWAYMTQACRGLGKLGYKYDDGRVLISIGVHKEHYVVVNPLGRYAGAVVNDIVRHLHHWSGKPVFIKHIKENDRQQLGAGYIGMAEYPWESDAPFDDATYPEVVIHHRSLEHIDTQVNVKYRLRLNRFLNHLASIAHDHLGIEHYDLFKHGEGVQALFERWADGDATRLEPYRNMLEHPPASGFSLVSCLLTTQVLGFHVFDRVGIHTAAVYANITDHRRIPGSSEACFLMAMAELEYHNITSINLGGSETVSLDAWKRKLNPHTLRDTRPDHLVYIGDSLPAQSVEAPTAHPPSPQR